MRLNILPKTAFFSTMFFFILFLFCCLAHLLMNQSVFFWLCRIYGRRTRSYSVAMNRRGGKKSTDFLALKLIEEYSNRFAIFWKTEAISVKLWSHKRGNFVALGYTTPPPNNSIRFITYTQTYTERRVRMCPR